MGMPWEIDDVTVKDEGRARRDEMGGRGNRNCIEVWWRSGWKQYRNTRRGESLEEGAKDGKDMGRYNHCRNLMSHTLNQPSHQPRLPPP